MKIRIFGFLAIALITGYVVGMREANRMHRNGVEPSELARNPRNDKIAEKRKEEEKLEKVHKSSLEGFTGVTPDPNIPYPETLRIVSGMTQVNNLLRVAIADNYKKIENKQFTLKPVNMTFFEIIDLRVALSNFTLTNLSFKFIPGFGVNPTTLTNFDVNLPQISTNFSADYNILYQQAGDENSTFIGNMTGGVTDLMYNVSLNTTTKGKGDVELNLTHVEASLDTVNANFTNDLIQKLWDRIIVTREGRQLMIQLATPLIQQALQDLNLAEIYSYNVSKHLEVTFGLKDLIKFPLIPVDNLLEDKEGGADTNRIQIRLFARFSFNDIPKPAKYSPVTPGDLNAPVNSFDWLTVAVDNDFLNKVAYYVYEAGFLDVELNQQNLTRLNQPVKLDTRGLSSFFPELNSKYDDHPKSVILKVTTPAWDVRRVFFRMDNGLISFHATISAGLWVFEDGVDPEMNLEKCQNKCVEAFGLEIGVSVAVGVAFLVDEQGENNLIVANPNVLISGVEVVKGSVAVDPNNLQRLLGDFLTSTLSGFDQNQVRIPKIFDNLLLSLDFTRDNRTLIGVSARKFGA